MANEYQIPTANDILSYRGDSGLAAGAGTGLMPVKTSPLEGIDSTLDKIQQVNAQKSIMDYKAKQDAQEKLAQMLAETGGSVFNMKGANGKNISFNPLPDDQKVLSDKAHELRKTILQNPENYMFNSDYLDKKAQYDRLVNHAGLRSNAYMTYNSDAQQTNDPDERKNIMSLRDSELNNHSLEEGHLPEPYLHKPVIADPIASKDWSDKKKLQEYKNTIEPRTDANGNTVNFEVKKIGIPVNEIQAPLYDQSTAGVDYIKNATLGFWALPQSQNPAYITKMNADIDARAKDMGIQPVYAATVNPNGQVIHNPNPREVAVALNIEKHGALQEEAKPTDAVGKQAKQDLDMVKIYHDMKDADEKLRLAKEKNDRDNSAESRKELEEARKEKTSYTASSQAAEGVYKSVTEGRGNARKTLTDIERQYPAAAKSTLAAAFANNNINPADYNVAPLSVDETLRHIAGVRDKSADGKKELPSSKKPQQAFYIKSKTGDVNDDRYLIGYKEPGQVTKDGKSIPDDKLPLAWKVVPVNEAINNSITSHANYSAVKPEYNDKAQEAFQEMMSGKASGTMNGASQQAPHSNPGTRPPNVPANAVLKGGYYVDKINKKIFNPQTGEEVTIK